MRFSTSFLRITLPTLLSVAAASCAYVIPDDPNQPRNNTVIGDRHRPQLNNVKGKSSSLARPTQQVAQVDSRDLPPVDPYVAERSERVVASNDVPLPVVAPTSGRRVPTENQEFQVAAMGYPDINSVPARPVTSGPDSAKERLSDVKSTLERDRANADASKEQLSRDAAAEPSMLSDLPKTDGVVPPNDPVKAVPAMPPAVVAPVGKPTSSNPSYSPVATRTVVPGMSPAQARRYAPEYAAAKPAVVAMNTYPAPVPVEVAPPSKPMVVASVAPMQTPVVKPVEVAVAPVPYPAPTPAEPVKQVVVASVAPAPVPAIPAAKDDMNQRLIDLPPLTPDSDTMVVQQPTRVTPPTVAPAQSVQPIQVQVTPVVVKKPAVVATQIATPPSVPMLPPPPPAASSMTSALPPATIVASAAPVQESAINLKRSDFDPMTITEPALPVASNAPLVRQGDFDPLAAAASADGNPGRPTVTTTTSSAASSYANTNYIAPSRYGNRY